MGIWDFINSSTEAVKRNAPDPVKNACKTSYNYGSAACRTSYGYGSAACTKIDHIVRVNGHQMVNQWLPDDEAKSKISIFATKFAKNAALYAVHEGHKFVPGGATVSNVVFKTINIVSKTIEEVERETLNEKPKPFDDRGSAPGKGFKYQKPMEDRGSAPWKGFKYQKLMDQEEMQPGSLDQVNVDSVDNQNPEDVKQIFRSRSCDDLMMPLLGKGEETSLVNGNCWDT